MKYAPTERTPAANSTVRPVPQQFHPPRPPLALRVGVTGHRPDLSKRPNPDVDQLRATARGILHCIADELVGIAATQFSHFDCSSSTGRPGTLRVVSALAAGSDQWLAEEAVSLGWELQCSLPFDRVEYRKDFADDAESRARFETLLDAASVVMELDGIVTSSAEGSRNQSYEAVGRSVLAQSDILIAVWDGGEARGVGGTGQIVREALQSGIPVVWIDWNATGSWQLHLPWRLLQTGRDKHGDFERLASLVRDLVLPPSMPSLTAHSATERDLREDYFREVPKAWNPLLGWWGVFRDLLCGDFASRDRFRVGEFDLVRRQGCAPIADVPFAVDDAHTPAEAMAGPNRVTPTDSYAMHYAWANALSIYYANLYRSSFLVNYMLGAVAVIFALLPVATNHVGTLWFAGVEATIISVAIVRTAIGWWWGWHERWIDYRTFAERLRLARFLALFGGGGQQVSLPGHLATYGNPASTWMHWHYRAIERAAGLPRAVFNANYLKACQRIWCEALIEDQKKYHRANHDRFDWIDKLLHWTGNGLFVLTLVPCLAHFVWNDSPFDGILILFAAGLPALGAACAAIRSHGEFHRVARRSAAMSARLADLQLTMAALPTRPGELNSVRFRECAQQVTTLMINEMLDWRVVFQDRPLVLPA